MPAVFPAFDVPLDPAKRIARIAARVEVARRRKARDSYPAFYSICEPDYVYGDWLADLGQHLEWAERTPGANLMIFAPPRHGKSQSVSRVLPNYLLGRHPRSEVLMISSTQDLADEFGRYVRNKLNDPLIQEIFPDAAIDPSANAVDKIVLKAGGGVRAVGVGGQIVGRGADWLIIDDPYKNRQQAYSANERDKLFGFYRTDCRTRLAPGARQILMHQRWHIDDLASKLLALAAADPLADQWRVVVYSAICENQETDPLGREVGWPLDPVRWPISALYAQRAILLETEWLALFQQRPVKEEGGFFKKDWMQLHSGVPDPKKLHWYIGWDGAASTSNSANKSAIVPIGFNEHGDGYIAPDFWLGRCTTLEQVLKVFDFIIKYKAIGVCVEKGMFERAIRPFYDVMIRERGLREQAVYSASTHMIARTEGKHIVAIPLQARMNQRKLWFPDTPQMRSEGIPQFLNFMPDADNDEDDLVDACFPAGSRVLTDRGLVPIEEVTTADKAWTRQGWKRVERVWCSGHKKVITRFGITATPDHKIWTKRGWCRLDRLTNLDTLHVCRTVLTPSFLKGSPTGDTRIPRGWRIANIFAPTDGKEIRGRSTSRSGKARTEAPSRQGTTYIIETETQTITHQKTWNACQRQSTGSNTSTKRKSADAPLASSSIWLESMGKPPNGIGPKPGPHGTWSRPSGSGKPQSPQRAKPVDAFSSGKHGRKTQIDIAGDAAQGRESVPVYDLTVSDAHEFVVEGVLVHNCANLYQAISQMALPMPEPGLPVAKPEDEEDAVWKKIMSNLPTTNSAPFARLSGDPLRGRK